MKSPFVSVIIPAFNEEGNIGFVLDRIHKVLKEMRLGYEVIVVDDGSLDRTAEVARQYKVQLVNHNGNLGKGAALRNGIARSKGDVIVTMDADGSHRSEDLPALINPILEDSAEVVIGSRFVYESGKGSTTRLHLIGNKIINAVILFLTGRYASDSQSGFRVYKRDVLRKISFGSSRYEVESELTVKILKNGFKIREIPINSLRRSTGRSKIYSFRDGFSIFKAILKATFCS